MQSARAGFNKVGQSCFTAGTPLLTPEGSKPIEQFREGDLILSRDQDDPNGPVTVQRVVDTFTRISPVLNLHVGGRIIETTREHPFYVEGKGWRTAHELQIGDVLLSHDGLRVAVEGVAESGRVETVYNLEVEDHHTYFVGSPEWGFDVWAHNANVLSYQGHIGEEDLKSSALRNRGKRLAQEQGREERVAELQMLEFDRNAPKHVRGWMAQERRLVDQGRLQAPRTPPGISLGMVDQLPLEKAMTTQIRAFKVRT
jgi:hypothetical protein